MNDEQRKARMERWNGYRSAAYQRWRVYSTFLTGFLIGLIYVVVISDWGEENILLWGIIDQRSLILMFSGVLGGVIYTILIDGHVEMPRFVANKGDKFEAGLFGDILLGIAGAVVLDFLTQATPLNAVDNIQVAALGLIGGYGGRAILQFALNRMFSDINILEEDRQKYLKLAYQQKIDAVDSLKIIDQLNKHIQNGLTNSELTELTTAIKQAPADIRKQVYELAKDCRRTANLSDLTKPRVERTIPIFEALADSEPDNHQYYAQAGFAYKDCELPDLFKANQYLSKAIEIRGDRYQAETWKYELNRAVIQIQQEYENKGTYDFSPAINDRIIGDLLVVAKIYNLPNILKASEEKNIPMPVWEWMKANWDNLEDREDTKELVASLASAIKGDGSDGSEDTPPLAVPIYREWIVAVKDTWLKKYPKPSDSLPSDEKKFCTVGTKYPIESFEVASNNHHSVKLGHGAGDWYIFDTDLDDHWKRSWENDSTDSDKVEVIRGLVMSKNRRKIDRAKFFEKYRETFKPILSGEQVSTFDAIFEYWDNSQYTDLRWLAYAMATAYHETGGRMIPVREGFAKSDEGSIKAVRKLFETRRITTDYSKPHANGKSYFGRGLVQITHGDNYKRLGKALGMGDDLYNDPNLTLKEEIAVKLLFAGMVDDLYRPGHKLSVYFNSSKEDWFNAREIINGDRDIESGGQKIGQLVADYGRKFYQCCQFAKIDEYWIEAVKDTWLKKEPTQADTLPDGKKKFCQAGMRYEVESYERAEEGHFFVKLAHNAGEWYIFDSKTADHWNTTWENDHDESGESTSTKAEEKIESIKIGSAGKQPVGDRFTKDMSFDTLITPHITYGELTKYQEARRFIHDYQCKTAYELCLFLEKCREHFGGKPLIITSGHRPEPINRQQGGARDSEHLYNHPQKGAIDFYIKGVNMYDLQNWCLQNYNGSIGKAAHKGFIHIGVRPGTRPQPWNY